MVKVKFFGIPKCHMKSLEISKQEPTIFRNLIEEMVPLSGVNLKEFLLEKGEIKKDLFILVNNKRLDEKGNLEALIKPGDTIIITRLLLGG